jgi:serine/threonine-protein kinase HipA
MLEAYTNGLKAGILSREKRDYCFTYSSQNADDFVSLTMPVRNKSYIYPKNSLHPIFDMNMPEGYLFELLKELLKKEVDRLDDLTLFEALAPNIDGRLSYKSTNGAKIEEIKKDYTLDELLGSKVDIFTELLHVFLAHSAISGVQPKVLATLKDKIKPDTKEHIVKSYGEEFPYLCENEYFCMQTARKAGLVTPNFYLSENKKLLIIERFTNGEKDGKRIGFEEACVLQGKNKSEKYSGSYEQLSKTIKTFVAPKNLEYSMDQFYRSLILSFIMRNGDAHLKNFGILYFEGHSDAIISPAYDIVTTTAYLPKDKPALTLQGKKIWWDKKTLVKFGHIYCNLPTAKATAIYDECAEAIRDGIRRLQEYTAQNPHFEKIGAMMIASWMDGLDGKSKKEVDFGYL